MMVEVHQVLFLEFLNLGAQDLSQNTDHEKTKLLPDGTSYGLAKR